MANKTSGKSQTFGVTRNVVLVAGAGTAAASMFSLELRAVAHRQLTRVETGQTVQHSMIVNA